MGLHSEIHEQPGVIERLLEGQSAQVQDAADFIHKQDILYTIIAARGTSDNAARYAGYLWGTKNHMTVALAMPSLFTFYHQPPQMTGSLVFGVSQSGRSPDIVNVLAEGRRQGAPAIAITNNVKSPLAEAADLVLDIQAGVEKAVAATKTYTAQLMTVAMLSAALDREHLERREELKQLPGWMKAVLELDKTLALQAQRYRYMQQCILLGRGYNYASAFEWALKLKELTYTLAEPYSSADFMHGPLALIQEGFPVLVINPSGSTFTPTYELAKKLRDEFRAELVIISDADEMLELAATPIRLPAGIPEWLSPLVSILPAQLFTYHLAQTRGYDTEAPRAIRKVTETH